MFRDRKRYADAAAVRFAESRNKAKRMGRVSFRNNFPVRDERFPRNASAFGVFAGKNTTALMSKPVIKALLKGKLGVKTVTGNGIDIFAGLIDKGVERALDVCVQIHNSAIAKGAKAHTFGTDIHMKAAGESGLVNDFVPMIPEVIEKRRLISELGQLRHQQARESGQGLKRVAFQSMPAITKAILTKMNKAAVLVNVPKQKPTVICSDFYRQIIASGGTEALKQQFRGTLAFQALGSIAAPFLDGTVSFFPGGALLAAASQDKWMNYETVVIMVGSLGFDGVTELLGKYHSRNSLTHDGFYSKWKLVMKDINDDRAGTLTAQRRGNLNRAILKSFVIERTVDQDKARLKSKFVDSPGFALSALYFDQYTRGLDAVKSGKVPDIAQEFAIYVITELGRFEALYH